MKGQGKVCCPFKEGGGQPSAVLGKERVWPGRFGVGDRAPLLRLSIALSIALMMSREDIKPVRAALPQSRTTFLTVTENFLLLSLWWRQYHQRPFS